MSAALVTACFWVLAATLTALLPMRRQYVPGLALLVTAPVLLAWLGHVHGGAVFGLCLAAVVSMFRNPLKYFLARLRGAQPERPE
ncbi:DUF2484 family protein [Thalassococcus profundi]|uniref:DUF2484 family protein n=1 Tax=Thalassococcus profundi TaxID=2282382 RepID=A0A369TP89_9RHOB|nr:DUF2484 family protein [Thalassococcus profundi]RDD66990.1 DUF2484 family protein [Thalassococcus profundi]